MQGEVLSFLSPLIPVVTANAIPVHVVCHNVEPKCIMLNPNADSGDSKISKEYLLKTKLKTKADVAANLMWVHT